MKKSVLLIGDTIVDKYHYLSPVGFSLETPTIKCEKLSTKIEFGGAANVARELSLLGCNVEFLTSIDSSLDEDLSNSTSTKLIKAGNETQVKERFYLTKTETYKYLQINDTPGVLNRINHRTIDFDVYDMIVISDYRLGVLDKNILSSLPKQKTICQMQVSDSKESLEKFKGFHAIVGNSKEVPNCDSIVASRFDSLLISTDGDGPVIACTPSQTYKIQPSPISGVRDYHGAGDAFYAGFCSTYDFKQSSIENSLKIGCEIALRYLKREQNVA